MTRAELRAELAARGFDYLDDDRLDLIINRACSRLDGLHRWPYREATASGTAPLTIATLGIVRAVRDTVTGCVLSPATYTEIEETYSDVATAGAPGFWYRQYTSGNPVVATYPTNSDTIRVDHWRTSATLTADGDTPLAPSRFHLLYVDIGVQIAYRDSDNHQAAESLQADIDRQVAEMVNELLFQQEPMYVQITGP